MIADLWYKLTGLCRHKWTIIGSGTYYCQRTHRQTGIYHELRCEHCSKLKEVRTYG